MKIDRSAVVAGQPVRKVRDVLRWLGAAGLAVPGFAKRLAIPEAEAERWLAGMLELGLLEPAGAPLDGTQYYRVTRDGAQLAAAVFLKRIDRAKAERVIADLLDRADAINADPDLLYRVATIDAFGSYITDAPKLGDLDLVLTLKFKDEKGDIAAANLARAAACGRDGLGYFARLTFGDREVRKRLQARNPYIGFTDPTTAKSLGVTLRRIYPRPDVR